MPVSVYQPSQSVLGTAPIVASTVGNEVDVSITPATDLAAGSMSGADKTKLDGIAPGAGVSSVGATAPITSSGGNTPTIAINAASGAGAGSMSAADFTKLGGITAGAAVASVGASSPISSSGGTTPTITFAIAAQAQGDVLYYNGANWVRLAADTTGKALLTGGAGANPSWATNFQAQNLLTTGTVGGGVATFDTTTQIRGLVGTTTYGALYCGATAIGAPSSSNFAFASLGSDTAINSSGTTRMVVNGVTNRVVANTTGLGFFATTPAARSTVSGVLSGSPTLAQVSAVLQLLVAALGDKANGVGLVHDTTT